MISLGTKTEYGTVEGIQFMDGERYYFVVDGSSVGYFPADVLEKDDLA